MEKIKVKFLAKKGFYQLGEEAVLPKDTVQGLVKRGVVEIVTAPEPVIEKPQSSKIKG